MPSLINNNQQNPDSPDDRIELTQPDSDSLEESSLPVFENNSLLSDSPPSLLDESQPKPEDGITTEETRPNHIYKVSLAKPEVWSDYTSLDTEEIDKTDEESKPSSSGWKTAWLIIREIGETIILTLIIFFLIQTVIRNFRVVGTSMADNLHNGQYLIVDKISYNQFLNNNFGIGGIQRGDIIVFEPPGHPNDDYVKRVIGLPGETIEIKDGKLYINDQIMEEPFNPAPTNYTLERRPIPEGNIFVLGDNRNNSNDSHSWGPLPIEKIVGRAWLSYWPPSQWGSIPRDIPTEQATLKYLLGDFVPGANAETK